MALIACPECKAQVSDRSVACVKCGYPLRDASHSPQTLAAAQQPRVPMGPIKYAYAGSLLLGVAIAAWIYLVQFDELSETALVQLTPLWFFFIVLGYYGLVAERARLTSQKSHGEQVADSLFEIIKAAAPGPVGKVFVGVVHLPLVLAKSRRSWIVALVGAAVWALALWIFFAAIFPSL